jgi:hypothetical protein
MLAQFPHRQAAIAPVLEPTPGCHLPNIRLSWTGPEAREFTRGRTLGPGIPPLIVRSILAWVTSV